MGLSVLATALLLIASGCGHKKETDTTSIVAGAQVLVLINMKKHNHSDNKDSLSLWGAVYMGTDVMIGAGIFASTFIRA